MAHRTVRDVMTAVVVTAALDTPFKELAVTMVERGVSALPVLDSAGHVAGVVSAGDVMRKEEYQEDPTAWHAPRFRHSAERSKAGGRTGRDLMTSPTVTVAPDATVVQAARLMDRHRIERLVVADADGRLEGIVTSRDLLRVYLRSDDEIRDEIVEEIITRDVRTNPALVKVTVTDGVVTLAGDVEEKSMIWLAVRLSRAVDGVVAVTDQLNFHTDDTPLPTITGLKGT